MPYIVILGEEEKKNGGAKIRNVFEKQEVVWFVLCVDWYHINTFLLSQDFVKMEDLVPELHKRLANIKEKSS